MAQHKDSVYRKISEDIAARIKSGEYQVGSMIEPERTLMVKYGVERTTVRRALEILSRDGLIIKKSGLGTFVSDGKSIPADKNNMTVKVEKKHKRTSLPDFIHIKPDVLSASRQIFDCLAEKGHVKVMSIGESTSKYAVICGEAVKCGLYDRELFVLSGKNNADDVFVSVWRSLRLPKPTAIILENEKDARMVLNTAKRMRIDVPKELSVIALLKDGYSEIAGCVADNAVKDKLLKILEQTADDSLCEMTVAANVMFEDGATFDEVKKDVLGSGNMSAFLL